METNKFGVKLKSAGSIDDNDADKKTSYSKKPSNINDIKSMFDDKGAAPQKNPGMDFKVKKVGSMDGKDDDLAFFSQFKFNIDINKNTTLERTNSEEEERFKQRGLRTNSVEKKMIKTAEPAESLPQESVAKSKVFSGGKAFQASTETKGVTHHAESGQSLAISTKQQASSALSATLALMRTRPGVGGAKSLESVSTKSSTVPTEKKESSLASSEPPWKKQLSQSSSSISSNAQKDPPWVKKTNTESTASRIRTWEKSGDSTSGKVGQQDGKVGQGLKSGNLSPRSKESGSGPEFGLAFNKKVEDTSGALKSKPTYYRQSSSESSASSVSSPRLSLRKTNATSQPSSGTASPTSRSFSPVNNALRTQKSEDSQPEWMNKSKELVGKFHTKLKKPEESETVNQRPRDAPSSTTAIKSSTTTTKTVPTTFNKPATSWKKEEASDDKVKGLRHVNKPAGKVTAKLTKEPLRKKESFGDSDSSSSSTDIKQKQYVARKMSSEQLQKIKGKFEQRESSEPKGEKPKLKMEICTTKNLLERKDSLEKVKSPEVKPNEKLKTLRNLQNDGKLLNIKDRISALNKGQGEIIQARRSSSGSSGRPSEEYNDIEGFEVYQKEQENDWPTTSESENEENMYEYIPATDPAKQMSESHKRTSTIPSRRPGLKRKNNARPSFDKEDTHDSSSELTASSKEGTMESQDDRAGVEGDIEEYNSDSSNSGIYEPITGDHIQRLKETKELGSQEDLPPELPPDRVKKSKNKKGIFKQFKLKLQQPKSDSDSSLSKVSSAPVLTGSGSTGIFKKVGKMMKRTKSSGNQAASFSEAGVCQSEESSDNPEENIYELDEPIQMKPCQRGEEILYIDQDSGSGSDYYEDDFPEPPPEAFQDPPPRPPPPPPPVPPLPPRMSGTYPQTSSGVAGKHLSPNPPEDGSQPVLPPRNRVSGNFSLETVVPVAQGVGSPPPVHGKPTWHPMPKDSYLHGHLVLDNRLSSTSSSDESHQNIDDYIQPDPPRGPPQRQDSEPDLPPPPPPPPVPPPVKRHKHKEPLEKRPSSGYAKFKDTARPVSENTVTAPFDHLMMYKSQLQLDQEGEDELYIDLSNDNQLYGTLDRRYTTKFESQPLYQCYHKDKVSRASAKNSVVPPSELSDDDTESGDSIYEVLPDMEETPEIKPDKPKLSTLEMFGKTGSVLRALWCEMPEVKESGILNSITSQERKIQESMFEIITSEASYLKSINVLIDVFLMSPEFSSEMSDRCVITRSERHVLFSNIGAVREASERFLADLEERWQKSVFITDICDIIHKHASDRFECYIRYCSNQTFQERATQELMKRSEVEEAVRRLERNPACQGLPMISFLLLPMQRITRLPLLVDAICHRLEPATERHRSATKALNALNKVVRKCNDGAKRMQQTEQICHLVQNLEFKVKEIPLVSASRYVVKQGELTRVLTESSSRLPFGNRKTQSMFLYLFNDMLLLSKRKGNNTYIVTDYAPRNSLHVESIEPGEKGEKGKTGGGFKHLFRVVLLENHEQKQVELIFSCKSTSDKSRWIDALSPGIREEENEKIYEEWDCPQVQCIHNYTAQEGDELTLEESDVVNVFKKMNDGWYEGERIRDGERGWFPANCTVEIVNSHVRARNLRLRYRLMQASEEFREVYNRGAKS